MKGAKVNKLQEEAKKMEERLNKLRTVMKSEKSKRETLGGATSGHFVGCPPRPKATKHPANSTARSTTSHRTESGSRTTTPKVSRHDHSVCTESVTDLPPNNSATEHDLPPICANGSADYSEYVEMTLQEYNTERLHSSQSSAITFRDPSQPPESCYVAPLQPKAYVDPFEIARKHLLRGKAKGQPSAAAGTVVSEEIADGAPGSLLQGSYDEKGSKKDFLEARREWLAEGSKEAASDPLDRSGSSKVLVSRPSSAAKCDGSTNTADTTNFGTQKLGTGPGGAVEAAARAALASLTSTEAAPTSTQVPESGGRFEGEEVNRSAPGCLLDGPAFDETESQRLFEEARSAFLQQSSVTSSSSTTATSLTSSSKPSLSSSHVTSSSKICCFQCYQVIPPEKLVSLPGFLSKLLADSGDSTNKSRAKFCSSHCCNIFSTTVKIKCAGQKCYRRFVLKDASDAYGSPLPAILSFQSGQGTNTGPATSAAIIKVATAFAEGSVTGLYCQTCANSPNPNAASISEVIARQKNADGDDSNTDTAVSVANKPTKTTVWGPTGPITSATAITPSAISFFDSPSRGPVKTEKRVIVEFPNED